MRTGALTEEFAAFAAQSSFESLPRPVQVEAGRAFLNWIGCALGGCKEPSVEIAAAVATSEGAGPIATLIGQNQKTGLTQAAFVNCLSSSALAFDDTHTATVTHPTGPVAAAALAWAQMVSVSGSELLNAIAVGIELQCRLSNALLLPPAEARLGFYITGLTGPVGAALAVGRLMGLDEQRLRWAIGLAANQASGSRATHGSMAGAFPPAHAARCGMIAALLAQRGFSCGDAALEAKSGFLEVFSATGKPEVALDRLGRHFELMANTYKPYPCGIVVHPAVDAALAVHARPDSAGRPAKLRLSVNPLAQKLADRPHPASFWEAQVSLQHWVAAAMLHGRAGLAEARQDCIDDDAIRQLRALVEIDTDEAMEREQAMLEILFEDGSRCASGLVTATGSIARPMTDTQLDAKFREQASLVLPSPQVETLLALCRSLPEVSNAGEAVGNLLNP